MSFIEGFYKKNLAEKNQISKEEMVVIAGKVKNRWEKEFLEENGRAIKEGYELQRIALHPNSYALSIIEIEDRIKLSHARMIKIQEKIHESFPEGWENLLDTCSEIF